MSTKSEPAAAWKSRAADFQRRSVRWGLLSRPIEAGFLFNPLSEVTQEATNDVPSIAPPHLNITLLIDSHDRVSVDTGGLEIIRMQFVVFHYFCQALAGHFYEFHRKTLAALLLVVIRGQSGVTSDTFPHATYQVGRTECDAAVPRGPSKYGNTNSSLCHGQPLEHLRIR